jgi:hypothetical protein
MNTRDQRAHRAFLAKPVGTALCAFLAIAAFFLWTEHRAHLLGVLPWLLLAVCPLMHLFMHSGHGGHGDHRGRGHDHESGGAHR